MMYHQGAESSTANFFNGSNYDAQRVYPAANATLTLTQKGQDKDNKELASITTCANGWFELDTELWTDRIYILKATLLNDDEGLLEETLETEITVTKIPKPGITDKISLSFQRQVKNYLLPSSAKGSEPAPLLDLKEKRDIPLVTPISNTDDDLNNKSEDGTVSLQFLNNAALVFNSFALKVPYVNQKAHSVNLVDNISITKTIEEKFLLLKRKKTVTNIETVALGKVSGSSLCFPTSTGMLAAYYGLGTDTSPPALAKQAYDLWRKKGFVKRDSGPITEGNNPEPPNSLLYLYRMETNPIWQHWFHMGEVMSNLTRGLSRFKQEKPWPDAAGQWKMHVEGSTNLLEPAKHNHLREEISRGWPIVVGTNATKGHVMLIKGLLLNDDGTVNRVICNDPYGNLEIAPTAVPGEVPVEATAKQKKIHSDERKAYLGKEQSYQRDELNTAQTASTLGKGAYYNVTTQGYQGFDRIPGQLVTLAGLGNRLPFTMTNHFALRFYFDRETIRSEKMVQGSQSKGDTPL